MRMTWARPAFARLTDWLERTDKIETLTTETCMLLREQTYFMCKYGLHSCGVWRAVAQLDQVAKGDTEPGQI